jgi:integrase
MQPITPDEFEAALQHPYNAALEYQAYAVQLYYTGTRVSENLRAVKEAYRVDKPILYWEVGRRLKHGKQTEPLPLSLELPHMKLLLEQVEKTKKGKRVFDFDRSTAWRHVNKSGLGYNHHARLSAITFFLSQGYSIAHIVNWFGVSVQTVNEYIGVLDLQKMGAMKR